MFRDLKYSAKAAKKYFPDGIETFDETILENLYKEEYNAEVNLQNALKRMKNAKENMRNKNSYCDSADDNI